MADGRYSAYRDGEYIEVPTMDKLCLALKDKFMRQEERIEYLEEEIKKLKDENWKDNELQSMKEQYDKMREDYYRGFPISEKQDKKIKEWINKHEEGKHHRSKMSYPRGGAIGGCYSYHFVPTSIGTFGTITCCTCGEKFEFQEVD